MAQQVPIQGARAQVQPKDKMPDLTGQRLQNRYEIGQMIGEGGYGTVYKCVDVDNGEKKAVKAINKNGPWAMAELRAFQGLKGVNGLVPMLDRFIHKNLLVIVNPLYDSNLDELRFRNKDHRLSKKAVFKISYDLTKTLQRMHTRGYIHRDVKTSNVMLLPFEGARFGRIVIIDLGLAKKIRSNEGPIPVKGGNRDFGTVDYTSWRISIGAPPAESEDLKMVATVLMMIRNISPYGKDAQLWTRRKLLVEQRPELVLTGSNKFLHGVVKALFDQIYGQWPDYDAILKTIDKEGGKKFNHDEPLKVIKGKKGLRLG